MARDITTLLHKAVPRLKKGDAKAQKLEARIVKLGASLWNKGPRGLRKIGVKLEPDDHRPLERDELLEGAREILGDREFVRFVRKVKDVLSQKLAKKASATQGAAGGESGSGRVSSKEKRRKARRKREAIEEQEQLEQVAVERPQTDLTMSGSGALAIPEDSGEGLVIPDDEGGLAIPGDDELAVPSLEPESGGGADALDFDLDNLDLEVASPSAGAAAEATPASLGIDEGQDDDDAARGAERALLRYGRTGEKSDLEAAKKLFKQAVKEAEGPVAQGAARGGLAKVYFLGGDLDKAKDLANKALKAFPHEPTANAVRCQVEWPKEVERERIKALLARAESAMSTSDHGEVKAVAKTLHKEFPKEPFAGLLLLAVECDTMSSDLEEPLRKAWKHYPASPEFGDLLLGERLERQIVGHGTDWLLTKIDDTADDGEVLKATVKDPTGKDNVWAGAFQIPLGLSRAALCGRRKMDTSEKQNVVLWAGKCVFAAQYYDQAKEIFGKAARVDREGGAIGEIRKMETQCGVLKRAFDRPGVKFKSGKIDGVGIERYREAVAARLKLVLDDLEGDRGKLEAKEAKIVDAILADPARKKAIQKAAKKAGNEDPFAAWDALEAEGAAAAEKPAKAEKKKGGLFGRMKAAAAGAVEKAKAAAQGAMLASKKKEARRAMGERLRDRPDKGWGDKELDSFLAKAALIEPRLDFLDSLAEDLRAAAGRAKDL